MLDGLLEVTALDQSTDILHPNRRLLALLLKLFNLKLVVGQVLLKLGFEGLDLGLEVQNLAVLRF